MWIGPTDTTTVPNILTNARPHDFSYPRLSNLQAVYALALGGRLTEAPWTT